MITDLYEIDGEWNLSFDCKPLPFEDHDGSGDFWSNVLVYLDEDLSDQLELDPEADMFCARGEKTYLEKASEILEPYLNDYEKLRILIDKAEAEDFEFDD